MAAKPKVCPTFAFWQQTDVFASAVRLDYDPAPPEIRLQLADDCKQCADMASQVEDICLAGLVTLGRHEEDDMEDDCHRLSIFDEEFEKFDHFKKRFQTTPEDRPLLPHQIEALEMWTNVSVESARTKQYTRPKLPKCHTGSGKTELAVRLLLGQHRMPATHVCVVCPKATIGQWVQTIIQKRPNARVVVWVIAPSYLKKVVAHETDELTLQMLRKHFTVVVDECKAYLRATDSRQRELDFLYKTREMYVLSATPVRCAKDIEPFFKLMHVSLVKDDGSFKSLQELCDELVEHKQIYYFDPSVCNEGWYKEHFPEKVYSINEVPMFYTQLAFYLMAERKLLISRLPGAHGPSLYQEAKPNSYHSRSRGYCNSVHLPSGRIFSPKTDFVVNAVKARPTLQTAVSSGYLDLGLRAITKKLDVAGLHSWVILEGKNTVPQRQKAMQLYNQKKKQMFLFSEAGQMGLDLWNTDRYYDFDIKENPFDKEQSDGRVARYHSHPPGSKVEMHLLISTIPNGEPCKEDWEGLAELSMDIYKLKGDWAQARELAKTELLPDLRNSLKHFNVTSTIEEQFLQGHARIKEEVRLVIDMLNLAGSWTRDSLRTALLRSLRLNSEEIDVDMTLDFELLPKLAAKKHQALFGHVLASVCN